MLHCRCDAVLMSIASTNVELSLVTVFSTHTREKYLKLGIYLIDVVLKLIVLSTRTIPCSDFQEAL